MRHAVDEIRLPLIQPNRFDRKKQIRHHADQQQHEKRRAQRQHRHVHRSVAGHDRRRDGDDHPADVSATTSTIITTPKEMGQLKERRVSKAER